MLKKFKVKMIDQQETPKEKIKNLWGCELLRKFLIGLRGLGLMKKKSQRTNTKEWSSLDGRIIFFFFSFSQFSTMGRKAHYEKRDERSSHKCQSDRSIKPGCQYFKTMANRPFSAPSSKLYSELRIGEKFLGFHSLE